MHPTNVIELDRIHSKDYHVVFISSTPRIAGFSQAVPSGKGNAINIKFPLRKGNWLSVKAVPKERESLIIEATQLYNNRRK